MSDRRSVSISGELYGSLQLHCKGREISVSGLVEHVMNKVLGTNEGRALTADFEKEHRVQVGRVRTLERENAYAVTTHPGALSAAVSAAPRATNAIAPSRPRRKFVPVKEARAERRAGILPGSDVGGGTRSPQPANIPTRAPGSRPF